jgi:hypothetical protein
MPTCGIENGKFKLIARDMGFFNHEYGLIFESADGIHWNEPEIAWYQTDYYFNQPPAPKHLSRYGRFERPQLLMKNIATTKSVYHVSNQ